LFRSSLRAPSCPLWFPLGLFVLFRHLHVIHFVRDAVVAEGFDDFRVVNEKDAGELEGISDNPADAVREIDAIADLTLPDSQPEELAELAALEGKRLVEPRFRITHAMFVLRSEFGEEFLCLLLLAHVHERDLRSRCRDLGPFLADVQDRRCAVGSTKVA